MTKIVINEIKTYVKPADKEKILVAVKEIQIVSVGIQGPPGVSGVEDHGVLDGLDDDDHTQYHNDARGDARYYLKAQVDSALATKANTSHLHDDRYYTESEIDAALANKAALSHAHTIANITGLEDELDGKAEIIHTHLIEDVDGLQVALDSKANIVHNHDSRYYTEAEIDSLLATKAQAVHTHTIGDIDSLEVELDNKANIAHTHSQADVVGLISALNNKANATHTHLIADIAGLQDELNLKAEILHSHVISDVTGLQTALDAKELTSNKGIAGGYASLDGTGKVPASQLPSFVDDVLEYANLAGFPVTGESAKIYVAIDTNRTYRWSGSAYIEISASPGTTDSLTEGASNLYFTNSRARSAVVVNTLAGNETNFSPSVASVVAALTGKSDVGHTHVIANVSGLQTALDGKANISHTHTINQITNTDTGQIPFSNGTNLVSSSAFIFDNVNLRLGLNITPTARLHVRSSSTSEYPILFGTSTVTAVGGLYVNNSNSGMAVFGSQNSAQSGICTAGGWPALVLKTAGDVVIASSAHSVSALGRLHVQVDNTSDAVLLHLRNVNTGFAGAIMQINRGTDATNIRRTQIVLQQNSVNRWAFGIPRRGGSGHDNIFAISKFEDINDGTPEFLLSQNGNLCLHGGWTNRDSHKLGVYNTSVNNPTLLIQNVASQTAHSLVINNSSASALTFFRANGTFKPVSLANTAAENDSIYFSTDANKLVYKDSSGTVNNLY